MKFFITKSAFILVILIQNLVNATECLKATRFGSICHSSIISGFFLHDSPDQFLISYSNDTNLIMWDISKNRTIHKFTGHKEGIIDALIYQNDILYSVSVNGFYGLIIEFNLSTGQQQNTHQQIELYDFVKAQLIVAESGVYSIFIDKGGQRINLYNTTTRDQKIYQLGIDLQQSQLVSIFLQKDNKLLLIYSNGLIITFSLFNQSGFEVEDLKISISQAFQLYDLNNSLILFSKQFSRISLKTDKSVKKILLIKEGELYQIENIEQVFYLSFGRKLVIKTTDRLIISSLKENVSTIDQVYNLNINNKYTLKKNNQIKQMIGVKNKCELFFSTFTGIFGRIVCGAKDVEYIDTQITYSTIYFLIQGDKILFTSENANIGIQIYSLSKMQIIQELRCFKEPLYTTNEPLISYFDSQNTTIYLATSTMVESYQTIGDQCNKLSIQENRQKQIKNSLINDIEGLIFTLDDTYFNVFDYFIQKLLITYTFNSTATQTWLFENKQLRKSYTCAKINGYIQIYEFDYQTKSLREISQISQNSLIDSVLFSNANQNIFIHSDVKTLSIYKISNSSSIPEMIYQPPITTGRMMVDYDNSTQIVYIFVSVTSIASVDFYSIAQNKTIKTIKPNVLTQDVPIRIYFKYFNGLFVVGSPNDQQTVLIKTFSDPYSSTLEIIRVKYNSDFQSQYIYVTNFLYIVEEFTIHQFQMNLTKINETQLNSDYFIKSVTDIKDRQILVFAIQNGGLIISNYDYSYTESILPQNQFLNFLFHPQQNIMYVVIQTKESNQASLNILPYFRYTSIYRDLQSLLTLSVDNDVVIFETLGIFISLTKINGQVFIFSFTSWQILKQFSLSECGFKESIQILFVKLNQIAFSGKNRICVVEFLNPFSKIISNQFYRIIKNKEIDLTQIKINSQFYDINIIFFLKCIKTDSTTCTLQLMKDYNLEIINEIPGLPDCQIRMLFSDFELIAVSSIQNEKMKIIFINYTQKQQQIYRQITLPNTIKQIEKINKEFFYIFDTSSNIIIYSLKNFEVNFNFQFNIKYSGQFYFDYTESNYLVLDSFRSNIQIGKLDIQLKTMELQYQISTCSYPQEMFILKSLDLVAVLCSQDYYYSIYQNSPKINNVYIHQLSNGILVSNYSKNVELIFNNKFFYIQSLNQILFRNKFSSYNYIIYNIAAVLMIPEIMNLEKNKFMIDQVIINSPQKSILFATKSNFIYSYQLEKSDIQINLQLSSKIRKLQIIVENLILVQCFEQFVIWDYKQQIQIASFPIQSNQIDIIEYSINSENPQEILVTIYVLSLPKTFQSIKININYQTNQAFLNITQTKQFPSQVIQVIHIKESNFFIVTTTEFKMYVQPYKLDKVHLSESSSSYIYNTIIIQLLYTNKNDTQIIFLRQYKNIIELNILQYQISNEGIQNNFVITQLLFKNVSSIQNPISTIKNDISWFIVAIKDSQTLYFYDIKKNEKGVLYTVESQIILPFRRIQHHINVNSQFNSILVNSEYSFIIYDITTKLPIFQIQDNSFLENQIVDMVMLNQSTLVVSTLNNLLIIQLSFENSVIFIASSYEILFKSSDKQLQIMNSYILINDMDSNVDFSVFILGYSLSTHEIIDYFIPIKSKDCKLSIENPNYFSLEERIKTTFSNDMENNQKKQLILKLTNSLDNTKQIVFPSTYNLQNITLIITGPYVYLDKIDFSKKLFKNVIIQNSNIYICYKLILEEYNLIQFSKCKFIQNCQITQRQQIDMQKKIQVKNINTLQINECEFIDQQIDDLITLLSVENFYEISISGLIIQSNYFSYFYTPIIYIKNGTSLNMENFNFSENTFVGGNIQINSLIQLVLITSVQIQTINLFKNQLVNTNYMMFFIFLLQGNKQIEIKNINFQKNINVLLLSSTTRVSDLYLLNKMLIQVDGQSLELNNINILENSVILTYTSIIDIFSSEKLLITSCQLKQNHLPMINCINIKGVEQIHIMDILINNNKINSVISIEDNNQFLLRDIKANNNTSTVSGTVLSITQTTADQQLQQSSKRLINYCTFSNNTAEYEGGVIYSKSVNYDIFNSQFFYNQAIVGGAIKYEILQPSFAKSKIKNNQRILMNIKVQNNTFHKNRAAFYGNDIGSYPLYAVINSYQAVDQLRISNFKSGGILEDLYIYILDDDGNRINFNFSLNSRNQENTNYQKIQLLKDSLIIYASNRNQSELDIKDNTKFTYSQDNFFNLKGIKLLGLPNSINPSIFILNFPFLISFDSNDKAIEGTLYNILVTFRPCQVGEIYSKLQQNIYECLECSQSKYSLIIPIKDSNQICKPCTQEGIKSCERNSLILQQGYWRKNESSDNPIYCYNQPSNCYGDPSKSYCIEGYIGPLCQTCDSKGEVWGEQFGKVRNYQCVKCSSLSDILQIQFVIALMILIHLILSIRSVIVRSEKQIICYVLKKIDWVQIGTTGEFTRYTTLTKFLMSYIQIIQTIQLNDFKFYFEMNQQIQQIFGNPIENMSNSLDCFFSQKQIRGHLPLEYARVIWNAIQPFVLLTILLLVYTIYLLFNPLKQFQDKYVYIALTFGLLYFQSGVISILITTISCEEIDGIKYLKSQLNKECYTIEHMTYIFIFILPIFLLWALIYPGLIMWQIYKNRYQLYTPYKLQKLGFYYSEYKQQYYYWEFVRMGFRILLISLGNILTSQNQITWKFGLFLFILSVYGIIMTNFHPYKAKIYNEFDSQLTKIMTGVLLFWHLNKISIETSQKQIFAYCYYSLLMFSYILFCIQIFKAISKEGFTLKQIFQTKCPALYKKWFVQSNRNPMKRFILWKRLKKKVSKLYKIHQSNSSFLQMKQLNLTSNDEIEEKTACLFTSSMNFRQLIHSQANNNFSMNLNRRQSNFYEKQDKKKIKDIYSL